jgi:hypothetical protein
VRSAVTAYILFPQLGSHFYEWQSVTAKSPWGCRQRPTVFYQMTTCTNTCTVSPLAACCAAGACPESWNASTGVEVAAVAGSGNVTYTVQQQDSPFFWIACQNGQLG